MTKIIRKNYIKRNAKKLHISLKKNLTFLIACFFNCIWHQSANTLLPMVVSAVGGQSDALGKVLFFATITKIPFFFFSDKISKSLGHKKSLILACAFFILQFTIILHAKNVLAVTIGMMFQGVAFAIILPNLRLFANKMAQMELSVSAQTLTDFMNFGLSGAISAFFSGMLIEIFGVSVLMTIGMILAIVAGVLFVKSRNYRISK